MWPNQEMETERINKPQNTPNASEDWLWIAMTVVIDISEFGLALRLLSLPSETANNQCKIYVM